MGEENNGYRALDDNCSIIVKNGHEMGQGGTYYLLPINLQNLLSCQKVSAASCSTISWP